MCDSSGKHGPNPGPLSSVLEVIFKEGLSECQPHCQSFKAWDGDKGRKRFGITRMFGKWSKGSYTQNWVSWTLAFVFLAEISCRKEESNLFLLIQSSGCTCSLGTTSWCHCLCPILEMLGKIMGKVCLRVIVTSDINVPLWQNFSHQEGKRRNISREWWLRQGAWHPAALGTAQ